MEEIFEIANQTITRLNRIIQEEITGTTDNDNDELGARLTTFEVVLDGFIGGNQRLQGAIELCEILQNFINTHS